MAGPVRPAPHARVSPAPCECTRKYISFDLSARSRSRMIVQRTPKDFFLRYCKWSCEKRRADERRRTCHQLLHARNPAPAKRVRTSSYSNTLTDASRAAPSAQKCAIQVPVTAAKIHHPLYAQRSHRRVRGRLSTSPRTASRSASSRTRDSRSAHATGASTSGLRRGEDSTRARMRKLRRTRCSSRSRPPVLCARSKCCDTRKRAAADHA